MSEDRWFKFVVSCIFASLLVVMWLLVFPFLPWSRPPAPRRADYIFVGSSSESSEMFDAWVRGDQVRARDEQTTVSLGGGGGHSPADVTADWWNATDAWEMMTDQERFQYSRAKPGEIEQAAVVGWVVR